jgi:hypothetical protein
MRGLRVFRFVQCDFPSKCPGELGDSRFLHLNQLLPTPRIAGLAGDVKLPV